MADDLNIFSLESLLYFPEQIYKVYKKNYLSKFHLFWRIWWGVLLEGKDNAILKYQNNCYMNHSNLMLVN